MIIRYSNATGSLILAHAQACIWSEGVAQLLRI
jgi:hypothetical protein